MKCIPFTRKLLTIKREVIKVDMTLVNQTFTVWENQRRSNPMRGWITPFNTTFNPLSIRRIFSCLGYSWMQPDIPELRDPMILPLVWNYRYLNITVTLLCPLSGTDQCPSVKVLCVWLNGPRSHTVLWRARKHDPCPTWRQNTEWMGMGQWLGVGQGYQG